jgi:hypothetical protein
MNTVRTSVTKNQNLLLSVFLRSLYYTFPFGMFMIACNCLFNWVRNYYFDWMIVVLPTIAVCIIASLYEMFVMYQEKGIFFKRENTFGTKQGSYSMSNANLATS